jgi:hypothetical protein
MTEDGSKTQRTARTEVSETRKGKWKMMEVEEEEDEEDKEENERRKREKTDAERREKEWRIRIEDFMGQMADRDIRRENRERKMIEIMERMKYRMGKLVGLMKELVGNGERKEVGVTEKEMDERNDRKEDEDKDEQDKRTENRRKRK